jgi:hypothetical protein
VPPLSKRCESLSCFYHSDEKQTLGSGTESEKTTPEHYKIIIIIIIIAHGTNVFSNNVLINFSTIFLTHFHYITESNIHLKNLIPNDWELLNKYITVNKTVLSKIYYPVFYK